MLRIVSLALLVLFCLGFGLAQAQEEDQAYLDYRQKLMKAQGASMGSIGDYFKYKLPYPPSQVATHAKNISGYATLIAEAFKKNVTTGNTDAQAVVWEHWDDFVSKAEALSTAAGKLAAAAEGGDMKAMMPNVKALGEACRGCHNTYRKPEEERFPR